LSSYPSGTVTFLFTDIEGSTKLAREHPDLWESLRERHHAIVQSAIKSHNGYVFQIIGDAFCAAFHTAVDGITAAVEAQRRLQNEDWKEAIIRVRMGLHTGSAELHGTDYRGYLTMAKVQRVMSVAHGGQVLLSNASAEQLHSELREGITLRDMKEHWLKGLPAPERLWQLDAPDLQKDFASLSSISETPNNLPLQLTTFIGREKEIDQIKKRLEKNRLVTLIGSGGVGKTRLSVQVTSELLDEYPNGVWLVELAPITDPSLVVQTVCGALDVTPQGNMPALKVLTEYLKSKKILLVMDNCEHLIDPCAQLCDSLLHACPDLRMIATSRETLGIDGENAYRVPSLSLPDPNSKLENIKQSEAVQLFVERANTILPGYALTEANASNIAEICQRLDGIALAIELAASRVKLLKADQIKARLEDTFQLLTGGSRTALPRQQTLRGTIDWSYNLLSDEERAVLRYLSVFVGGWTLEAAEAVCGNPDILDLLTHLVDKSLVAVDREHSKEARYHLLETIHQYAREKLAESSEGEQIRARHLDYFLQLAQRAEPELYGAGQIEWLQKLEEEHENMLAVLEGSLEGNMVAGQQLAAALWWSWDLSGRLSEGYEWLRRMLVANPEEETLSRAKLLAGAGWLAGLLGYSDQKKELAEKSVALYRNLGNKREIAIPLITLGSIATQHSDYGRANELLNESLDLFKDAGNNWGIGFVLSMLAFHAQAQENYDQAWKFFEESLLIFRKIRDDDACAWTLYGMGQLAEIQGEDARAMELYEEAIQLEKVVKSKPVTSWILRFMGDVSIRHKDYKRGEEVHKEAIDICDRMGDHAGVAYSLESLGWSALLQRDYAKSQSLYKEGLQLVSQLKNKADIAGCIIGIGQLVGVRDSLEKFARMLGMAEAAVPDIKKLLLPFFYAETEKFIEDARAVLGDEAYLAAWQAGMQTNLNEAIEYALKELQ
jgi:predicted ATPase/class 3 adenylate cyclase